MTKIFILGPCGKQVTSDFHAFHNALESCTLDLSPITQPQGASFSAYGSIP